MGPVRAHRPDRDLHSAGSGRHLTASLPVAFGQVTGSGGPFFLVGFASLLKCFIYSLLPILLFLRVPATTVMDVLQRRGGRPKKHVSYGESE